MNILVHIDNQTPPAKTKLCNKFNNKLNLENQIKQIYILKESKVQLMMKNLIISSKNWRNKAFNNNRDHLII